MSGHLRSPNALAEPHPRYRTDAVASYPIFNSNPWKPPFPAAAAAAAVQVVQVTFVGFGVATAYAQYGRLTSNIETQKGGWQILISAALDNAAAEGQRQHASVHDTFR